MISGPSQPQTVASVDVEAPRGDHRVDFVDRDVAHIDLDALRKRAGGNVQGHTVWKGYDPAPRPHGHRPNLPAQEPSCRLFGSDLQVGHTPCSRQRPVIRGPARVDVSGLDRVAGRKVLDLDRVAQDIARKRKPCRAALGPVPRREARVDDRTPKQRVERS